MLGCEICRVLKLWLPFTSQGDLGAIDEKYDVAISSSCSALDNIVVDTMDTAVKCVRFLRQNNVGVATFIGLDKVGVVLSSICGVLDICFHTHHTLSLSPTDWTLEEQSDQQDTNVCTSRQSTLH